MDDSIDDLRGRLEVISDRLGDHIMATLRDALEAGEKSRPEIERVLSRARRAVDKAVLLLGQLDAETND